MTMSAKCKKEECSLCPHKLFGRRHCHPDGMAGLYLFQATQSQGDPKLCVCAACDSAVSNKHDKVEP